MFEEIKAFLNLLKSDWANAILFLIVAAVLVFLVAFLKDAGKRAVSPVLRAIKILWTRNKPHFLKILMATIASVVLLLWISRDTCSSLPPDVSVEEVIRCNSNQ